MVKLKSYWLLSCIILIGLFTLSLSSANLGTFKAGDCVNIKTILNSTYANISTISYPNSSIALENQNMTKIGHTFNLNFCNTSTLGTYTYDYFDDSGNVYVNDFAITITGSDRINSGEGLSVTAGIVIMILIAVFFFVLFLKTEHFGLKTIFIALSSVMFLISIMFSMVMITNILGNYSSLVSGFETFFFVIKILLYIAVPAFMLFAMYIAYKLWKVKRGRD